MPTSFDPAYWQHRLAEQPLAWLLLFLLASILMIWRLNVLERQGFAGTLIGTLIMPYCSGAANLAFAWSIAASGTVLGGQLVMENAIINNLTNLLLVLGLAPVLMASVQSGKTLQPREQQLQRLDLLLTLIALFLFTGVLWALGRDGQVSLQDGLILIALFVFWQIIHVFDVLRNKVRGKQELSIWLVMELLLIALATALVCLAIDRLVSWAEHSPALEVGQLGWLSGLLGVLPNALLAAYYAKHGRQDIVVSSQIGDGHICIPMCIGLYALYRPLTVPAYFEFGMQLLLLAGAVHFICQLLLGRLPKFLGWALAGSYAGFMYAGVFS